MSGSHIVLESSQVLSQAVNVLESAAAAMDTNQQANLQAVGESLSQLGQFLYLAEEGMINGCDCG